MQQLQLELRVSGVLQIDMKNDDTYKAAAQLSAARLRTDQIRVLSLYLISAKVGCMTLLV
jgi:hypothetical protein